MSSSSSSSYRRYNQDVSNKTHCDCKPPHPIPIQTAWTTDNPGRRCELNWIEIEGGNVEATIRVILEFDRDMVLRRIILHYFAVDITNMEKAKAISTRCAEALRVDPVPTRIDGMYGYQRHIQRLTVDKLVPYGKAIGIKMD
ncbi:hypothetical protein Tco_1313833 [Tanacetum coccineum]